MRLLIVGTLNGQIGAAAQIAMASGAKILQADSVEQALLLMRNGQGAELVMADVKLDIKSLIDSLAAERISVPVVACGVGTDSTAAVRSIRAGAKEYIPLPPNAELIAAILAAVSEENHAIVHRDPRMAATLKLADQIAVSDASVLITGESGTGKELMARYIHGKSKRAKNRFVALNCAAIPENLLESELFGHEKGAFTGAVARRIGKFEEAHGGTLLLDEISEMDVRLQSKLLRAIQEREIDRVGGTQPVKIDVRILATSNRDLESEVRKGTFRQDLYFRLNVVNLIIPPLRERPADIALLAEHFVKKYAEVNGLPVRTIAPEAMQMLFGHHWSGNVRELENTLHRAVLLASGNLIGPEAILLSGTSGAVAPNAATPSASPTLPTAPAQPVPPPAGPVGYGPGGAIPSPLIGKTVAEVERGLILDTLQHTLGNRTHAANILGISIRTLRNKLKQYGDEGFAVPPPSGGEVERAIP